MNVSWTKDVVVEGTKNGTPTDLHPPDETSRIDDFKKILKIVGNRIGWEIPKIAWKPMKAIGLYWRRFTCIWLERPIQDDVDVYSASLFFTRKARKAGNFNLFSQENCLKMVFPLATRLIGNLKMILETNGWNLKKAPSWKRKIIFQISMFRLHVNFQGGKWNVNTSSFARSVGFQIPCWFSTSEPTDGNHEAWYKSLSWKPVDWRLQWWSPWTVKQTPCWSPRRTNDKRREFV